MPAAPPAVCPPRPPPCQRQAPVWQTEARAETTQPRTLITLSLYMLTWDQWDLNWNVWLNGFLKMSYASKSLRKLKSPPGKVVGRRGGVLIWMSIVCLTLFTEITEKRMNLYCWWNGKWDLGKHSILQDSASERRRCLYFSFIRNGNSLKQKWGARGVKQE